MIRRIYGVLFMFVTVIVLLVTANRAQAAVWEFDAVAGEILLEEGDSQEWDTFHAWLAKAKEAEAEITGEDVEEISDDRFIVRNLLELDRRLISAIHRVEDTKTHTVYVIGADIKPVGIVIASLFDGVVYSNLLKQELVVEGTTYYIAEFSIKRTVDPEMCTHSYEQTKESAAGCLEQGMERWVCTTCGDEKETIFPALGHIDVDEDVVCDRCRMSIEHSDDEEAEPVHWAIGDIQAREIDGTVYFFECIDQNYSDRSGTYKDAALFLCTEVIPANVGSEYVFERQSDGTMGYTFVPGPIVNFGDDNNYKNSKVHAWLAQAGSGFFNCESIHIGVDSAYMGATAAECYGDFDADSLQSYDVGYQDLTGKLFSLSVDEAIKYKHYLWRFGGSDIENPETQIGTFCKAYWLRNPMGSSGSFSGTGQVYVVDLVNGNIRPNAIKPDSGSDVEMGMTTSVGVRPAFAMPQD